MGPLDVDLIITAIINKKNSSIKIITKDIEKSKNLFITDRKFN
jgi:hypothetical protein